MYTYNCAKCKKEATVENQQVVRACSCPKDTGITVNLQAVVTGENKIGLKE